MNENIEERINLQKALFEAEDTLLCNRYRGRHQRTHDGSWLHPQG